MKKTPAPTQNGVVVPSLFHAAGHPEDLAPCVSLKKIAPTSGQTPFADLILHPDKLEAALKAAEAENEAFDASRTTRRNGSKRTAQNSPTKAVTIKKNSADVSRQTKKVEFFLKAPSAKSVKLAANFTDWEKCPLDMMQSEDGIWFSTIPLAPGQYSYRFIVDGQWCDDPRSTRRVPNPFGSENALLVVT